MNRIPEVRIVAFLPVFLAIITLATFAPVFQNDFIKFDDGFYIVHNQHVVSGLTWDNLGWALGTGYQGNWHPVTWISHMADVELFGLQPAWHHLMSLIFHTANALLLMTLLQRLTKAPWRSFFVAALFAVHPLHVESVAWAAERKDVLSTFFFLLTLLAYAGYASAKDRGVQSADRRLQTTDDRVSGQSGEKGRQDQCESLNRVSLLQRIRIIMEHPQLIYVLALMLFALALMSKPMAVTAPFVMLLLDFWPLARLGTVKTRASLPRATEGSKSGLCFSSALKWLIREKIPFFSLAAIASLVTLLVQERGRAMYLGLPVSQRTANALVSYWRYLGQTVWPKDLAIFYPHPANRYSLSQHWPPWLVLAAALGLGLVSWSVLLRRRQMPWLTLGWFWYAGTLVPAIGIVQVGGQAMADRYTYIPLIGIFLCLVWAAAELTRDRPHGRAAVAVAGAAAVGICAALTWTQATYWRNDFTVFEHALAITSNNALAHYHVGIAFRDRGQTEKAMGHFRAAVAADPSFAPAYSEIGAILEIEGKDKEAFELYEQAIKATPWAQQIHNHMGSRLWAAGRQEEALSQYAAALRCDPDYPDAHFNLGLALSGRQQFADAAKHFAAVCRLRPGDTEALGCLAETLTKQGRLAQAADCFLKLTRIAPTNAEAHQNLGLVLVQQGELGQAITQFRQAAQLKPNWPEALNALAWALATHPRADLRNGAEAVTLAERACELSGGKQARFWGTLDVAYAEAGRFTDAIVAATRAKSLAQAAGQTNAAQAADSRIQLYRQQKPYRP